MSSEPTIVQKRGIDVTPHYHGIWCAIGDGAPFVNTIVIREWSEDGRRIICMLDSHNSYSFEPDQLVGVVEEHPRHVPSRSKLFTGKWDDYGMSAEEFLRLRPELKHERFEATDVY